jgi:hypothetical protein
VLPKLLSFLAWSVTMVLTIDFLARLWQTLGVTVATAALAVQTALLVVMTIRVLLTAFFRWPVPSRGAWRYSLVVMGLVAAGTLSVFYTYAEPAALPALLTGWWALLWAYLALIAIPLAPIVLVPVQGVAVMRWRLLIVLLTVTGIACNVAWTVMI